MDGIINEGDMFNLEKIQSFLIVTTLFLFGCGPDTSKFNEQLKSKNLLDSEITFNKTCDVLYYCESRDSDGECWVIYSENKLNFPVEGDIRESFNLKLEIIRDAIKYAGRSKYKEIINPKSCIRYDWMQNKAEYRGFIINATNGYFLYLERFGK